METQVLRIALGSLAEVGYGLHLAKRLDYLTEKEFLAIEKQVSGVAAPLHGLIASVRAGIAESANE